MQVTVDPAVRDCVGDKMHTLKAEHPEWSQEQRIAVALNMCGQRRGGDAEAVYSELYGGQYQANVSRAVELTNAAQGVIRGYVFLWGSPNGENGVGRDSYDTWFDRARPPSFSYDGDLRGYPICIEHGLDPASRPGVAAGLRRRRCCLALASCQYDGSEQQARSLPPFLQPRTGRVIVNSNKVAHIFLQRLHHR